MSNTNMTEKKRNAVVVSEIVRDGSGVATGISFTFPDLGEKFAVGIGDLTDAMRNEAIFHGLRAKIQDGAAMSKDPATGKSATPKDKYDACFEIFNRIVNDHEWNKRAEGGAGGANGGLLFAALVRLYADRTKDQIREFLDRKTDKEQAALRTNPKVAAIIAEIKAERAAEKAGDLDTDAMLEELEG